MEKDFKNRFIILLVGLSFILIGTKILRCPMLIKHFVSIALFALLISINKYFIRVARIDYQNKIKVIFIVLCYLYYFVSYNVSVGIYFLICIVFVSYFNWKETTYKLEVKSNFTPFVYSYSNGRTKTMLTTLVSILIYIIVLIL